MTSERRTVFKNLAGFILTRPPCVIFVIFLSIFAFGLFALGYYIQHNDIVDAKTSEDWNHVYNQFSLLTFCLSASNQWNNTHNISSSNIKYNGYEDMVNISLPFQLTVKPIPDSKLLNISQFAGVIPFFYLKFQDYFVHEHPIWINLESEVLTGYCLIEQDEMNPKCREITYIACVTFMLPKHVVSLIPPKVCKSNISQHETTANLEVLKPEIRSKRRNKPSCAGQIELTLTKRKQYDTDVFLSIEEKSELNLRLQLGGYFLFVILLSFLLFAAIRGRPFKPLKKIMA